MVFRKLDINMQKVKLDHLLTPYRRKTQKELKTYKLDLKQYNS